MNTDKHGSGPPMDADERRSDWWMPQATVAQVRPFWLLLSFALMLGSAYFAMLWIGAAGAVSGWIGLPSYAAALERVEREARWWLALTLGLPFVAAYGLMWGIRLAPEVGFVAQYALRVIASMLGAFGFLLVLLVISS